MRSGIKELVRSILKEDEKARDSDKYLYVEVVKRLNPSLAYAPLSVAFADADIPCFETVSRARRFWQEHFPSLRGKESVQEYREALQDEYKELFGSIN